MRQAYAYRGGPLLTTQIYANRRLSEVAYPCAGSTSGFDRTRYTSYDPSGLPLQSMDGRDVVTNYLYNSPDGALTKDTCLWSELKWGQVTKIFLPCVKTEFPYLLRATQTIFGDIKRAADTAKKSNQKKLGSLTTLNDISIQI